MDIIKNLIRIVRNIASVIALIILLTLVVIYVKDEKLSKKSQLFYEQMTINNIEAASNNFYYYMGFDSNHNNDPVQRYLTYVESKKNDDEIRTKEYFNSQDTTLYILHNKEIYPWKENYVEIVTKNSSLIDSLWNNFSYLENEYFDVSSNDEFQSFSDLSELNAEFQSFSDLFELNDTNPDFMNFDLLKNAYLTLKFVNNNYDFSVVNTDIINQLSHIRKLMRQADYYSTKLSFLIIFERNLMLLDKLLDSVNLSVNELSKIILSIEPISIQERDFTNSIKKDFNQDLLIIKRNSKHDFNGYRGIFKKIYFILTTSKNKYINRNVHTFDYIIDLSKMTGIEFNNEKDKIKKYGLESHSNDFNLVQNLTDEWFSKTRFYSFFIDHYHNVDCYITLLKLKQLIYTKNTTKEQIPQFLMQNKKFLNNPYSGAEINWNPEKSTLYIGDEFIKDWNSLGYINMKLNEFH